MSELRPVKPGEALRIPAATYNEFVAAARYFRDRQQDQRGMPPSGGEDSGIVLVRNESGAARARFEVLGLQAPIILPADSLENFKNRPAFVGRLPIAADVGAFVVLQEPLDVDAIGRGKIAGVTPVQLENADSDSLFADAKAGSAAVLTPTGSGSARIIWKAASSGTVWALVRMGGGGGGAGTAATPYVMLAGTGTTAQIDTWDRDNQPAGKDGVQYDGPRVVYSATANKFYLFRRTVTYDSAGAVKAISAETRVDIFDTELCS